MNFRLRSLPIFCWIWALSSASSFAFSWAPEQSLLRIESSYRDEGTRKNTKVTGQGVLLKIGRNLVALTSSHVSQGSDLKISSLSGAPLQFSKRRADFFAEIELIFIQAKDLPKPMKPLAEWVSSEKQFLVAIEDTLQWHAFMQSVRLHPAEVSAKWAIYLDQEEILLLPQADPRTPRDTDATYVQRSLEGDFLFRRWAQNTLSPDERLLGYRFFPGMSGSPTLRFGNSKRWLKVFVSGLVTRSHRTLPLSMTSTDTAIARLVADHAKPFRVNGSWRLKEGTLFRAMDDGTVELPAGLAPRGNGTFADGGNGTFADGGHTAKHSPRNLPGGFVYKGIPALAIVLHSKSKSAVPIYGDFSALSFMSRIGQTPSELVKPGDNLTRWALPLGSYRSSSGDQLEVLASGISLRLIGSAHPIELNNQGSCCKDAVFRPICGDAQNSVDITGLYFLQPNLVPDRSTKENRQSFIESRFQAWANSRSVLVRPQGSSNAPAREVRFSLPRR